MLQFGAVEKVLLPVMLAIIMFGMGMGLTTRDFRRISETPFQVLLGSFGHFVIMPIAACCVVVLLRLPFELALGVMLVGSCPSGATSNLINYLAKGDVALAVTITTLSTLICPLFTPLILSLFSYIMDVPGNEISISFIEMIKLVLVIIVIPISVGMTVRRFYYKFSLAIERPYKIFSLLFLVFVIVFVMHKNRNELWNMLALVGTAVVLHNILGFALGYFVPRILRVPEIQSRTIAIEMAIQNTTLGMTIAVQFFPPAVALPSAVFSIWMYMTGLAMAYIWARRQPSLPLLQKDAAALSVAAGK
ncbi:MAG: bile acid:sodium symporter family protein [Thermodesulfobacteriota bacterium]